MKDYINNQHRYYTLDYYYKNKYNSKVFKVALNGNFTCPNRDGKISTLGCIFCSESGSGDFAGDKELPLKEQFEQVKAILLKKWPKAKYIPYFQANTNTYGPISKLKALFNEAVTLDNDIVSISIATRPDCLSNETIEFLNELNQIKPLTIELGLQTIHDSTAKVINRGYNLNVFEDAVKRLNKYNIEIVVHIINGLPYESKEDMLETIKFINTLDIQGVKIHSLLVLKNTALANLYEKEKFKILSLEEYVDITVSQIELLRPDIIIHRLGADSSLEDLIEPLWTRKKLVVMNEIDKLLRKKDSYQGILYSGQQ